MAFAHRRATALILAGVVGLALVGWVAARQIRSPAQVAADTAPPRAAAITVPVKRRPLSTQVIVRGTVRYGAPQPVVLATSGVKGAATKQTSSDIVTQAPVKGAKLKNGAVVMTVDGRPVFALPGVVPMHRDLAPGDDGPDVGQLEQALARAGFDPGPVDGHYDSGTGAAVSSFYLRKGWDPFGATDTQLEALRTAEAAAAAARDARLQAITTIEQARQTPAPADIAQARLDAVTARDAYDTAVLAVRTARVRLGQARALARTAPAGRGAAVANQRRDEAAADADVAAKRADLNVAVDAEQIARLKVNELAVDALPSEREQAFADIREAADKVAQARADLQSSLRASAAVRAGGPPAIGQADDDAAQATRDARLARSELLRAVVGVRTARSQASLAAQRAGLLTHPTDTAGMHALAASSAQEAERTQAEVGRVATESGVQVPANEVLFFPTLPLRVDAVKAKRGDSVNGKVMDATTSELVVDSSLSVSDRALVRPGDRVEIEDQDLNIRTHGTVRAVSRTPGATPAGIAKIDPGRFYMVVVPSGGPNSLVGASVKLTISVKSTSGPVLTVPVSAVSVGGDGNARVQVERNGTIELVTVVPGLAADGLVEVRAAGPKPLRPDDLVIVGTRTGRPLAPATGGAGP